MSACYPVLSPTPTSATPARRPSPAVKAGHPVVTANKALLAAADVMHGAEAAIGKAKLDGPAFLAVAWIAGGEGMIQKILLAIALLALVGFLPRLIGMLRRKPMVSAEQLKQRLDAGEKLLLLDVRPDDGYHGELGHISQATHIPLNELPQRLDELDEYLERPVLTICRTDKMSSQAAQLLAQHGFVDVQVVKMGMVDWNKNGYPIESQHEQN